MKLDPEVCYRATLAKDRRFDGLFFAGVITTGVYCRPVCPVRPAKAENVRWFVCAAAAKAAGFRACRRCHPETAPRTPAWNGTRTSVSRALRLISEGALDESQVDGFAERLGITGRHLRRLFASHLGASPIQVARAHRVHFAKTLIDQTNLPITKIAFSSGFESVRQFNHSIRETFGRAPTAMRRGNVTPGNGSNGHGLVLRLLYRPPLDWAALLSFLSVRAIPGVEVVENEVYRRTIEIGGTQGTIEVSSVPNEPCLLMRVRMANFDGLMGVVERVRRIFDLNADPTEIGAYLERSEFLRRAVKAHPGIRVPGAWDGFEVAVRAILGQQITVRGATTLAGKLVRAYGTPLVNPNASLTHLFPRPEVLADADLHEIGLPKSRCETVRSLASAVFRGDLRMSTSAGLEDAVERLSRIPGIGEWTANYIAMRAYGEPDAFPAGDLWLRRSSSDTKPVTDSRLSLMAEAWRPWRAYAVMHLWMR